MRLYRILTSFRPDSYTDSLPVISAMVSVISRARDGRQRTVSP
jgi:hypothetical protein